jgi:transketolase
MLTKQHSIRVKKRLLAMHHHSNVGHIGGNLSALDALLVLFHDVLDDVDEFVLSKGHSAGALYAVLWSVGILNDDDLNTFHKDDTLLPAHPPANRIPRISFATGSLGHGLSLAAGLALAQKLKWQNRRVFCLTSDGEWQEGSIWEALIFSAHHNLSNLTVMIDHNKLQGFGTTNDVASMSPLWEKIKGFDVSISVIDGHDIDAIRAGLQKETSRPHFVFLKTVKGKGISFMENKMEWHYLPLSNEQYQIAITEMDQS